MLKAREEYKEGVRFKNDIVRLTETMLKEEL
jgi:hypothetical protein